MHAMHVRGKSVGHMMLRRQVAYATDGHGTMAMVARESKWERERVHHSHRWTSNLSSFSLLYVFISAHRINFSLLLFASLFYHSNNVFVTSNFFLLLFSMNCFSSSTDFRWATSEKFPWVSKKFFWVEIILKHFCNKMKLWNLGLEPSIENFEFKIKTLKSR